MISYLFTSLYNKQFNKYLCATDRDNALQSLEQKDIVSFDFRPKLMSQPITLKQAYA
jgi:hypothetical protein